VVLRATGYVKLMEKLGHAPATWQYTIKEPRGDVEIVLEDVVTTGAISHAGIQINVDLPADSRSEGVDEATRYAEVALTVLSAAGRAVTTSAQPVLAFESTPGKKEREFVQWYWDVPIPTPKTSAPTAIFGRLMDGLITETDEKRVARVALSMSWHRRAVGEQEPTTRFLMLWIALEAVAARVAETYMITKDAGFQGLRRLAVDSGGSEDQISELLRIRRSLLHDFGKSKPVQIRADADEVIPVMERLLLRAWCLVLLGDMSHVDVFPNGSIRPYPVRVILYGTVNALELQSRDRNDLPHFRLNLQLNDSTVEQDGTVTTTIPTSFTFVDSQGATATGGHYEIWGPDGPDAVRLDAGEARFVPADGSNDQT
jgi:hypothetical protein